MIARRLPLAAFAAATLFTSVAFSAPAFAQGTITIEVPPAIPPILPDATLAVTARLEGAPTLAPPTLADIKTRAVNEIAKRQATLLDLTAKLAAAKSDCGQNGAVSANVSATQAGLTTLGATIAADTDLAKAKIDFRAIFGSYRVYLLVTPRAHIALNCDNHMFYGVNLKASAARLAAAIVVAQAKGIDTTLASANLAQAQAAIDPAVARDVAALNSVMGLVPDLGNAAVLAANTAVLRAARNEEQAADSALDGARALLKSGWESLRGANAAAKVVRKAEHEAAKNAREAQRNALKAARDAAKSARQAAKHGGAVVVSH